MANGDDDRRLVPIGAIAADAENAPTPDAEDKRDLKQAMALLALKDGELAHTQRKEYATKLYKVTLTWLGFVAFVLLFEGFLPDSWFHLADSIVVAVVAGATAGALGYFAIVLRNIFPENR